MTIYMCCNIAYGLEHAVSNYHIAAFNLVRCIFLRIKVI
jgi:hypothetical protein